MVLAAHPEDILKLAPILIREPFKTFNSWYDEEGDVLYLNFNEPNVAADSELTDEDYIVRYGQEGKIIGITILHASKRKKLEKIRIPEGRRSVAGTSKRVANKAGKLLSSKGASKTVRSVAGSDLEQRRKKPAKPSRKGGRR